MVQVPLYNIPSGPYATWGVYVTPGSDVPPVPPVADKTLRFEFSDISYDPQTAGAGSSGTWTKRNEYTSKNVWDWTRSGSNWSNSFYHNDGDFIDPNNEVSIIGCGDLSAVTNMSYMFYKCSSLVSISYLDTAHATDVSELFRGVGCTQLPDLDFSSVTCADGAFTQCENLVTAPNITFPTGHSFTANTLLSECFSLVSLPLYDFTYCTSMDEFASQCTNLVNVPAMNTPNVTSMQEAFKNTAITSIPALDYSSVTNTYCMFNNCTGLTAITPINAPNITYAQSMFNGCANVTSGALAMYNYLLDKVTTAQAYENVFLNCGINTNTGFADLEKIPQNWGGLLPNENTLRLSFENLDYNPETQSLTPDGTWTRRTEYTGNVWDYTNTTLYRKFYNTGSQEKYAVIATGKLKYTSIEGAFMLSRMTSCCDLDLTECPITASYAVFYRCGFLNNMGTIRFPSGITSFNNMFQSSGLHQMPVLVIPEGSSFSVTNMFSITTLVQSGIYDMYEYLSSFNVTNSNDCFTRCGEHTSAYSELDMIPTTWGGNLAVLGGGYSGGGSDLGGEDPQEFIE